MPIRFEYAPPSAFMGLGAAAGRADYNRSLADKLFQAQMRQQEMAQAAAIEQQQMNQRQAFGERELAFRQQARERELMFGAAVDAAQQQRQLAQQEKIAGMRYGGDGDTLSYGAASSSMSRPGVIEPAWGDDPAAIPDEQMLSPFGQTKAAELKSELEAIEKSRASGDLTDAQYMDALTSHSRNVQAVEWHKYKQGPPPWGQLPGPDAGLWQAKNGGWYTTEFSPRTGVQVRQQSPPPDEAELKFKQQEAEIKRQEAEQAAEIKRQEREEDLRIKKEEALIKAYADTKKALTKEEDILELTYPDRPEGPDNELVPTGKKRTVEPQPEEIEAFLDRADRYVRRRLGELPEDETPAGPIATPQAAQPAAALWESQGRNEAAMSGPGEVVEIGDQMAEPEELQPSELVKPGNRPVDQVALVFGVPPGESEAMADKMGLLFDAATGKPWWDVEKRQRNRASFVKLHAAIKAKKLEGKLPEDYQEDTAELLAVMQRLGLLGTLQKQ